MKVKAFVWLALQNKIMTKINLFFIIGWTGSIFCEFCSDLEDIDHLFIHYPIMAQFWDPKNHVFHFNNF